VGRKYVELADLMAQDTDAYAITVAIGVSARAGIAASDAACISATGRYWRGQDHAQALKHLGTTRGSDSAARALQELLALKDQSHYGFGDLSSTKAKTALRSAHSDRFRSRRSASMTEQFA
jgi:hypothetical protein